MAGDQLDFSAELAKAKAENPDAIFVFYPGKAGVQFLSNMRSPVSRARFHSIPHSPSMSFHCRCRRTWRWACPVRRNG